MAKSDQVYLTIFAFRPALRLGVKRNQTIGTGDIINPAALTCTENKPPPGHLKSSERFHPIHKCPLRDRQQAALKTPSVLVPVC